MRGAPCPSHILFPLRGGRLVRPSRKAAEECLRLVSRRLALDARGIDVGWPARGGRGVRIGHRR
nr:MAG TPA: hypothetical protein [Caudoviricetes sp.]